MDYINIKALSLEKINTFELYSVCFLQLFQLFLDATQKMCYLYVSSPNLLLQHYMQIVVYLVYCYNFVMYQGFDQLM
jgi:hypothetical protein